VILVLVEHDAGGPSAGSLEALALVRRLAAALAEPLEAVAVGEGDDKLAPVLGDHGVATLHAAAVATDGAYAPRAFARAVLALLPPGGEPAAGSGTPPRAVVAPATDRGSEVMAHVAALASLPLAAGCVEIAAEGDAWRVRRLRWAGSIVEEALVEPGGPGLFTVAPEAAAAEPTEAPTTTAVRPYEVALEASDLVVRVAEVVEPEGGGISLTEARVVVGGGRGVGGEEGFGALEELAGLLGGAVGVSRAVTSLGWRPHRDQIGQTGCRIAPELYIACGISGAIQHMVGCKGAKRLLAINTDVDAPIMSRADYAVVGDLHVVVPAIVAELRKG
jgi:electron transfer flavoprotein alpha subunit